jgi:DNA-binding beta-propeller fold protein YncE
MKVFIIGAALFSGGIGTAIAQAPDGDLAADVVVLHKMKTMGDLPGDLAFLNLASGKVVARVPVGREPHEVAISSDGRYALTTNTGANSNPGNTLSLIDIAARKELRRVNLGALRSPHGVWYQGGRFYFTAEGSRAIGAYDPVTDHVVWIMGTGQDTTHNLVVSRDGKMIFTANRGSHTVTAFELTGAPEAYNAWRTTIIPVCRSPQGLDLSPDGRELWVGCRGSNEMAIINAMEKKVSGMFPTQTGQLARVRFTPDGKRVLAADLGRGELSIWDAATHQELKRLKLGSYAEGILILPDGRRALIGVTTDDNVAEVDLETMQVTRRFYTGQSPDGMGWIGPR